MFNLKKSSFTFLILLISFSSVFARGKQDIIEEDSHVIDTYQVISKENQNEEIEIAKVVWDEINYFNTDFGKKELEIARNILEKGVNDFQNAKTEVEGLYAFCENDKELKRKIKTQLRNFNVANTTVKNHFPNGVVEFDSSIFNDLFEEADRIEYKINDVINEIKKAKEEKTSFADQKNKLKRLRKQQNTVHLAIKTTTKEKAFYIRAVKPYIEAQRCVERYENYKSLAVEL